MHKTIVNILAAPKELLIAALVASIPLFFESIRDLEPKPEENSKFLQHQFAV
jgi:hypothetical protein